MRKFDAGARIRKFHFSLPPAPSRADPPRAASIAPPVDRSACPARCSDDSASRQRRAAPPDSNQHRAGRREHRSVRIRTVTRRARNSLRGQIRDGPGGGHARALGQRTRMARAGRASQPRRARAVDDDCHVDVYPRRFLARRRQHAVSLHLRRRRRESDGRVAVHNLLSRCGNRRGARNGVDRARVRGSP